MRVRNSARAFILNEKRNSFRKILIQNGYWE